MAKKYLIYRDDIYDPQFTSENDSDIKISLGDTRLETSDNDPANPVILTKEKTVELINQYITSSAEYVGDIEFTDITDITNRINDYNNGTAILLKDGRTFGNDSSGADVIGIAGNTLEFVPSATSALIRPETALVNLELEMLLTTNNNQLTSVVVDLGLQIANLQSTKEDKESHLNFVRLDGTTEMEPGYQAVEDQSLPTKIQVDTKNIQQDTIITDNTLRVAEVERLISGGAGANINDSTLLWTGVIQPDPSSNASVGSFQGPLLDNDGETFSYANGQALTVWFTTANSGNTGSPTSKSIDIIVGEDYTECNFEDDNFDMKVRLGVDGMLACERTSGTASISTEITLTAMKEITTIATADLATKTDLVEKQNTIDNSLQTVSKSVVGAINEVKLAEDSSTIRQFTSGNGDNTSTSAERRLQNLDGHGVHIQADQEDAHIELEAPDGVVRFNGPSPRHQTGNVVIQAISSSGPYLESKSWEQLFSATHDIGDFKWSYNNSLETSPSSGWVKANGRSTSPMSAAAQSVFGSTLPNLISGNRFIRASATAGNYQDGTTAANGLRINGSTVTSSRNYILAGSMGYQQSSSSSNSHLFSSVTHTTGNYGGVVRSTGTSAASVFGTAKGNYRPDGTSSSASTGGVNYGYTTAAMRVLGMSMAGDSETRPINMTMIPYVWVG